MELILPSFIGIILAAVIILAVVPKIPQETSFFITLFILAVMVYVHVNTFKSEYNFKAWFTNAATIAIPLLIVLGCVGGIAAILGFTKGVSIPFLSLTSSSTKSFMSSRKNYKNISPDQLLNLQRQL